MKRILLLAFLMLAQHIGAQSALVEYPLPEKHRVKGTYSMKLNDSTSIHFAMTKNRKTKKMELKPFLITNEETKELNSVSFEENPEIISVHLSKDIVTLLYKIPVQYRPVLKTEIFVRDINVLENTSSPAKLIRVGDYKTVLHDDGATYFFGEKNNAFFVYKVENTNTIVWKTYTLKRGISMEHFLKIKDKKNVYIKTDAFVDIGSTSSAQLFKHGNVFYATYDDNRKPETYLYILPFEGENANEELSFKKFSSSLPKNRVHKSFFTADYLFEFSAGRKEAVIDIFNHHTGSRVKSLHYSSEKFGPYHEYYFKGKKIEPKEDRFFKSFNSFRLYSTYSPAPFITVNMSSDKGYIVEIGHVNGNTYRYNPAYDHMMWHQQMWQQQQMLNNTIRNLPKVGGPDPGDDYGQPLLFAEPVSKTSLKLSLNNALNVTETLSEAMHNTIDYDETIKTINRLTTIKNRSYTHFDTYVRYMAFHQTSQSFVIRDKPLIEK